MQQELTLETLVEMYQQIGQRTVTEMARSAGITRQRLVALWDRAGLTGRTPQDPSPEEIANAALEIQKAWDEKTRLRRWVAARLIRRDCDYSYMEGR